MPTQPTRRAVLGAALAVSRHGSPRRLFRRWRRRPRRCALPRRCAGLRYVRLARRQGSRGGRGGARLRPRARGLPHRHPRPARPRRRADRRLLGVRGPASRARGAGDGGRHARPHPRQPSAGAHLPALARPRPAQRHGRGPRADPAGHRAGGRLRVPVHRAAPGDVLVPPALRRPAGPGAVRAADRRGPEGAVGVRQGVGRRPRRLGRRRGRVHSGRRPRGAVRGHGRRDGPRRAHHVGRGGREGRER